MTIHWSQLPAAHIERLDKVRTREIKRGGKVTGYEPGRFLNVEHGGQKVTYMLNEQGRVRVIK